MNQTKVFVQKVQQVLCPKHGSRDRDCFISLFDISKETLKGNRILCSRCTAFRKQILNSNEVDSYLQQWYKSEQNKKQIFQTKIDQRGKMLEKQINDIKKFFLQHLERISKQISDYINNLQKVFEKNSQTRFMVIMDNIEKDNHNSELLQDIAEFISEQDTSNREQILLIDKYGIPNPFTLIDKIKFNNILNILKKINSEILKPIKIGNDEVTSHSNSPQSIYSDPIKLTDSIYITSTAISNNDQLIASGNEKGDIAIWSIPNLKQIQQFEGERKIQDLKFSKDDQLLAASQYSESYQILLFDISKNNSTKPIIRLKGHQGTIFRISFSFDSQYLVSGSNDQYLRIWKISNQKSVFKQKLSEDILGIDISQNQKYISVACQIGKAYLFDCENVEKSNKLLNWQSHSQQALCTIFTPDSKYVLTSHKTVKMWSISQLLEKDSEKKPLRVFKGKGLIWSMQLYLDCQILIGNDGTIQIWSFGNGKLLTKLPIPGEYHQQNDANFGSTQNLEYIVTGGGQLKVFKLRND